MSPRLSTSPILWILSYAEFFPLSIKMFVCICAWSTTLSNTSSLVIGLWVKLFSVNPDDGSKNIAFGNVIIWDSQGAFNVDGSCAIVVKVKNNIIYIADQNVSNKSWNGKCYSRKLYVNENNVIEDREYPDTKITGWLKYN